MTRVYDSIKNEYVAQFRKREDAIEFVNAANKAAGFLRYEVK